MTEEDEAFNDIERMSKVKQTLVKAQLDKPVRKWVGLTDEELIQLSNKWRIIYGGHVGDFAYEIEAKLKEKNT